MKTFPVSGGCLCGAVRYRLKAEPVRSMVCHCRTCRRVSGAPVLAWLLTAEKDFEILVGKPVQFMSSRKVTRQFCGQCGTQLTYANMDDPGEIDVTTCSLDDPGLFPPAYHSWLDHDVAWLRFGDGLPAYPGSRFAEDGEG